MNKADLQALKEQESSTLFNFFVVHFKDVQKLVRKSLPSGSDEETITVVVVGIFRQVFRALPRLIAANPSIDPAQYLLHVAADRCRSYTLNTAWVNVVHDRWESAFPSSREQKSATGFMKRLGVDRRSHLSDLPLGSSPADAIPSRIKRQHPE